MAHVDSKYLEFLPADMKPGHKTQWIAVYSKSSKFALGFIEWYGAWRQYTFNPSPETTFNNGCLREIADYCTQLNAEQRAAPVAQADQEQGE